MSKCSKCHSSPCCCNPCDSNSIKNLRNDLDSMMQYVDELQGLTKFLAGHPIMGIEDSADIAAFDLATGLGTGKWVGWGICNGNNYPGKSGANIATPDLRDRFLTGSQGTYIIGDQGGINTVTLGLGEMPAHNHAVTDPGHNHTVNDPGHTHTGTVANHTHAGQVDVPVTTSVAKAAEPANAANSPATISTNPAGVTNNAANSGISLAQSGSGAAHENRPPYYAVLFIKKIY